MSNEPTIKAKPRFTPEQWDAKNREWSRQKYEDLYGILSDKSTLANELTRIGGGYIPMDNLASLSRLLVSHPNATPETIASIIKTLHALWWGEAPSECQLTWECIEKCYSEWRESSLSREDWLTDNNVSISAFKYISLR